MMWKNRAQYIFLIILSALLSILPDSSFMLLILSALLLLPVCSFLLLLVIHREVALTGSSTLMQAPTPEIIFTLANRSRLPVPAVEWALVIEHNLSGSRTDRVLRSMIHGRSDKVVCLALASARTGKIRIITQRAVVMDFLGLFSFPVPMPDMIEIYIDPKIYEIEQAWMDRRESDGNRDSYSQGKAGSDVHEIFALHEYAEGDDLRRVHWKLSAKTGVLMVRDFGLPLDSQTTLLLELSAAGGRDYGKRLSFSVDILASLSTALAQRGIVHNLAWFDDVYEAFRLVQIAEPADLYIHLPALLDARVYESGPEALRSYIQSGEAGSGILLYYITAQPDAALIRQAAEVQTMRTIIVGDGQADGSADLWLEAPEVIHAPLSNLRAGSIN
ncbi:MAG: DUF58 domain-containing protein [Peptococcaceae bacterium]|jgi:uncharacterized protein (DUF58 family)|nr:DUF58 domain-containing protein [Peptococcaceae bacterium]